MLSGASTFLMNIGAGMVVCLLFRDRFFFVLVAEYDHTLPLPVFVVLLACMSRGGRRKIRVLTSEPSHFRTAPHLFAPIFLPSYTYFIYRRSHMCSNSILYVL